MSYLLFWDESGHDRRSMPHEIHGGIALRDEKIWPLVLAMEQLETACFGDHLHKYKSEIKGHKLLDKDRFEWAAQASELDDLERRKLCISFLNKGSQKRALPKTSLRHTAKLA